MVWETIFVSVAWFALDCAVSLTSTSRSLEVLTASPALSCSKISAPELSSKRERRYIAAPNDLEKVYPLTL